MAQVYQFVSPATLSPEMSLDFEGAAVQVVFYDALGVPVNPNGQGKLYARGGTRPTGHERIFKPNTAYLLRQRMISAQDIAAYLTWYSGRLDAPFLRPPP